MQKTSSFRDIFINTRFTGISCVPVKLTRILQKIDLIISETNYTINLQI